MGNTPLSQRIQHVVVLVLENRAFDHLFGFFEPGGQQKIENLTAAPRSNLLNPAQPASTTNPTFAATAPAPFAVHDKDGPSHSFESVCVQLCNDKNGPSAASPVQNNGFVASYAADLLRRTHQVDAAHVAEVMESFAPSQLPAMNQLANAFCLCDHWFCEVPGPTMPNRMYLHAATSEGYVHNAFSRPYTSKTVYELFEEKGLSWAIYFDDLNDLLQFPKLAPTPDHFRRFTQSWAKDVANGNLPTYTFLFPRFNNKKATGKTPALFANSQHAPEDVRYGEHLIADVYDALAGNAALWNQSALIVTYDEHGGFYDHVAPGPAPNPDGQNSPNPDDKANFALPAFAFDRLGLRVPALIASPWIPKGIVENRNLQHTSILKTVTEIFGLNGPLNRRDASAASFADLFMTLSEPRPASEMPAKLTRPSLKNVAHSTVAGVPVDPGDEPLDDLTKPWVEGMAALAHARSAPHAVEAHAPQKTPSTQNEACEYLEQRLHAAFGI